MNSRCLVSRRKVTRRGLTLMEMVVVLTILVGLAAILVPLFPNLLRRTHKATDATQTAETAKAVQLYQAAYVSYPDDYDLLTDGTAFPAYLPGGSANAFGGYVTAGTLTPDQVAALNRVGILKVQKLAPDNTGANFQATMNPYAGATPAADRVDISGGTSTANFAILNKANITNGLLQTDIASDPTATYVVFGVGPRCSMVGKTIMNAPTSVPQDKGFTPDNTYCRIGLIYKVGGSEVAKTERARLVAVVAMEDDELESTEKDIVGYYQVAGGEAP